MRPPSKTVWIVFSYVTDFWRDPSDENKSVTPITRMGGDRKAMESKQVVVKTPSRAGYKFCLSQEGFLKDEGFFLSMDLNTLQKKDGCDRLPKTLWNKVNLKCLVSLGLTKFAMPCLWPIWVYWTLSWVSFGVMLVPACTLTLSALCQFSRVTPDKLGVGRSFLAICDPWDPNLPFLIRLKPFFSTNLCALRVPACSAKNALISSIELPL